MANSLPMTLRLYRKLSSAMVPLAPALIKRRLKLGKEDPQRVGERRGMSADVVSLLDVWERARNRAEEPPSRIPLLCGAVVLYAHFSS